jgi:hypothetical protein
MLFRFIVPPFSWSGAGRPADPSLKIASLAEGPIGVKT